MKFKFCRYHNIVITSRLYKFVEYIILLYNHYHTWFEITRSLLLYIIIMAYILCIKNRMHIAYIGLDILLLLLLLYK